MGKEKKLELEWKENIDAVSKATTGITSSDS